MTIKECYEMIGADFADVMGRLQKESLVEKFFLRFETDNSMVTLHNAMDENNIDECFRAAHTLKSVSGNLSFTELSKASHDLTEQLRSKTEAPDADLVKKVEEEYEKVMEALKLFKAQK